MGLRGTVRRLAAGAPAQVFALAGTGASMPVQDLLLQPQLDLVDTPSAANVLLVAGAVPDRFETELARMHDALSSPRAALWWPLGSNAAPAVPTSDVVAGTDPQRLVDAVVAAHRRLLMGNTPSASPVLRDEEPAPWRGVGPYGQGGTGMTGGVPYGRPMAEVAPDRDGLRLDTLTVRIGPFFVRFPTGLVIDVDLQGDVVQRADVVIGPPAPANRVDTGPRSPFRDALEKPVPVAVLELSRTRSHLRWAASALTAHQLPSLARRVLRLAHQVQPGQEEEIGGLHRLLRGSQVLGWATTGVGHLEPSQLLGTATGPVSRAAGVVEDERTSDIAYRGLGFEPIVRDGGDARARFEQRLDEARQALQLAERAPDRVHDPEAPLESPRGRLTPTDNPTARLLPLLADVLPGMEWGDAVSTVVSLDLDPDDVVALGDPDRAVAAP